MAAVGAMALVLAGAVAAPAEARPRSAAVATANQSVDTCFSLGGEPTIYEFPVAFNFGCIYEDGSTDWFDIPYDE